MAVFAHSSETQSIDVRALQGISSLSLITMRWGAVIGQTLAVVVALHLDVPLAVIPIAILIFALGVSNVFLSWLGLRKYIFHSRHFAAVLLFDFVQISALIWCSGGYANPFFVMMIIPPIIAATILPFRHLLFTLFLVLPIVLGIYLFPHADTQAIAVAIAAFDHVTWPIALLACLIFLAVFLWRFTEQNRRNQHALQETQIMLAGAQKMSVIDGLSAAIAHELNTPLATIALITHEMRMRDVSKEDEDITTLITETARCVELIASIPQFGTQMPQPLKVLDAVAQLLADLPDFSDSPISITTHVDERAQGPEPEIIYSAEWCYGLRNILQNAVRFSEKTVTITLYWSDEILQISVRDDGPGFPAHIIAQFGQAIQDHT
ncbi:MAG: ATP-binding protein, partial [Pseudomonadota bacterium]